MPHKANYTNHTLRYTEAKPENFWEKHRRTSWRDGAAPIVRESNFHWAIANFCGQQPAAKRKRIIFCTY